MKEYHSHVEAAVLYKENTQLLEDISKVCDRKKIMKISVPNYKLFASFNILVNEDDIRYGGQYLTSRDRMICEENVYEHLIDNKEAKRIREANAHHDNKSHDKIQTEKLALGIALKNFDKKYGKLLTTEQKDCLVKFYTTKDSRDFTQWMRKRIGFILDEIADRKSRIDNDKIRTKIDLVEDKLKHIATENTLSTKSLKDVLLSLEMKDNLKLF